MIQAELDLEAEFAVQFDKKKGVYGEVIEELLTLKSDAQSMQPSEAEVFQKLSKAWPEFKPYVQRLDHINSLLPYKKPKSRATLPKDITKYLLEAWSDEAEMVHFSVPLPQLMSLQAKKSQSKSMLVAFPRQYRDIGTQELDEFLELCQVVAEQLQYFRHSEEYNQVSLVPLHPLMINQKGQPDYARRCPYPAILFTITSSN